MKKETLEEFLARGGEIKKYDPVEPEEKVEVIKPVHASAHLMSLDEGALFFSERQKRRKASAEEKNKAGRDSLSSAAAKYLNRSESEQSN
jgi:hypothetical protein